MLLAPDFYVFVMYFCVFNGESTEVGYRSLTEWTSSGQSTNF